MPIYFVASSYITNSGAGSTLASPSAGRTLTLPAAVQAGDFVLATYTFQGSGTTMTVTTAPTGLTALTPLETYNAAATIGGSVSYYRVLDGSETPGTTTYINTWSGTPRSAEMISVFRGATPTGGVSGTPLDVSVPTAVNTGTTTSTTKTSPAMTTVTPNVLAIIIGGIGTSPTQTTAVTWGTMPAGWTEAGEYGSTNTGSVKETAVIHAYSVIPMPATVPAVSFTTSVATAGDINMIGLRPLTQIRTPPIGTNQARNRASSF